MSRSNRLLLIPLFVILIILAIYFVIWKQQADRYLAMAQSSLTQINSAPIAEGVTVKIEQSAMSVGGFPFQHALKLKNPVFHLEYSIGALKALAMQTSAKALPPQTPGAPPAVFPAQPGDGTLIDTDYRVDGEMTLAIHYFTTHTDVKMAGAISGETRANGFSLPFKSDGTVRSDCNLSFRFASLGMFLGSLVHQQPIPVQEIASYVKGASCRAEPQKIVAADNGEPLYSSSEYLLDAAKIHFDPAAMRLLAHVRIKDYEIFDRAERFSAALVLNQKPDAIQLLPFQQHDVIGKTNLDLTVGLLSENGTSFFTKGMQSNGHLRFDASTADFSNNLMTLSGPLLIEFSSSQSVANFTIRQHGSYSFNAAFDSAMENTMKRNLEDKATRDTLATQFGAADKADTLSGYISDVLPKLNGFGTIKTDIDVYGNFSETVPPASIGAIHAKQLRFSTDPYGLSLAGDYDVASKIGAMNVDCTHCPQLISDAVEYNNRVQKTLTALHPEHQDFNISPDFYQAIMTFLGDLNTGKDKDNIALSVTSDGKNNVSISGKPFLQVMMKAMQTFGPFVSQEGSTPIAPADPEP